MSKGKRKKEKKVAVNKYANMKKGDGRKEQKRKTQSGAPVDYGSSVGSSSQSLPSPTPPPSFQASKRPPSVQTPERPERPERPEPRVIIPPKPKIIEAPAVHTPRPSGSMAVMPGENFDGFLD